MGKNIYQHQVYGYTGRLLRINLTSGKASSEELDPEILRTYVGGVGFGTRLLYDELPAGINALTPENKLVFTTGPLTGTTAPGAGSLHLCFKSPLTGVWADSRVGTDWGGLQKKAGYDFLVIEGKAEKPSYVVVRDGTVEIRPADGLVGKTTSQKDKIVKDQLKDKGFAVAVIGPAGEKFVKYANIMIGDRALGRCGGGAAMASKNLLALAVKGTGEIPIAKPNEFLQLCKAVTRRILDSQSRQEFNWAAGGTTQYMLTADRQGDQPTKNFRSNSSGKADEVYSTFMKNNFVRAYPCYSGCVLRCGRRAKVKEGRWQTPEHGGASYETMSSFTFYCLNWDVDAAVHAGYLCNEYGIDTISTGACIAFAMDCYDEGIISKAEADGLELIWGSADTMVALLHKIGRREGFLGELLGEGVRQASKAIGKGSEKLAIHIKGLEGAAHDARSSRLMVVTYGTANRGMCHTHPCEGIIFDSLKMEMGLTPYGFPNPETVDRWDPRGKGTLAKQLQDYCIWPDMLGICKFYTYFGGYTPGEIVRIASLATGWNMDYEFLSAAGARTINLQRKFNTREGIRKKDDLLPERCRQRPEFGAYAKIEECEIKEEENKKLLEEYYIARGWDKDGVPLDRGY